mgnify:CR=1 FL=1
MIKLHSAVTHYPPQRFVCLLSQSGSSRHTCIIAWRPVLFDGLDGCLGMTHNLVFRILVFKFRNIGILERTFPSIVCIAVKFRKSDLCSIEIVHCIPISASYCWNSKRDSIYCYGDCFLHVIISSIETSKCECLRNKIIIAKQVFVKTIKSEDGLI